MTKNQIHEMFPIGDPSGRYILMDPVSAISTGIGVLGSVAGGILGSSAAKKAAAVQKQTADQAAGMTETATSGAQAGMGAAEGIANTTLGNAGSLASTLYGSETNNLNPYLAAGAQGAGQMAAALAPGGSLSTQFTAPTAAEAAATPGYQFTMQQGLNALNRSAAAGGGVNSGNTLAALTQYGQGLASTNYQQTYNNALNTFQTNHQNTLQGLTALTNIGQNATNQLNQSTQAFSGLNASIAGQQSANTMGSAQYSGNIGLQGSQIAGQDLIGGANAQAAGMMGSANAWSSALGGVGNAAMNGAALNSMNTYLNGGGGGSTFSGTPTPFNSAALANYMPAPTLAPAATPNYQLPGFIPTYSSPAPSPAGGL